LIVLITMVVSSFFAGFLGRNTFPVPLASFTYQLGTSWFFISIYLLMIFLLLDLLRITHLFPMNKMLVGNWWTLGVLTALLTIIMGSGYLRYTQKEKVELSISIHKEQIAPLKIVALSDLHLGFTIGKKELEKWIELINKENPDMVLIVGDIIDNNTRYLFEQNMAATFKKIKTKYGIYAAIGNHEYIGGNISDALIFMEQSDITVLRDSVALVNDAFYIVGRDDWMNKERKSVAELIRQLDHSKPIIMLDHQPFHLEEAAENGIDLQLSGHTHDGQIWPVSWITNLIYEKSHGYLKKGNSHIYVTSGIGIWGGKFRIGTQSEYVVIEMN